MKRLILVTAFVLLGLGLSADNPPESPDDYTRELMRFSGNIHQFNNMFPQEKVYLEFDNTAYFQGETIWFKAFVTHATTLKRAPSKVLYVDFLAPTGQLLKQQKFKIIAGQCDGTISLMDMSTAQSREKRGLVEYPSGFYEIRAYTQNMLNFSHEAIFSRVIPVYTKPNRYGDYNNSRVVVDEKNILIQHVREDADEDSRKINLSFFPEGGDLINGLPCNVAFKATGKDGFEINGALIYNDGADTAYTVHDGMGMFSIVPKGIGFVQFVTTEGKQRSFTLPRAIRSGYSMITQPVSDSHLKVSIARTSDRLGEQVALSVTCRGDVIYFQDIRDDDGSNLDIDCSDWPIGVCRMTLYNKDGRILSSRSIFHNNEKFRSPTISFSTDSMSRKPFSKEIINLKLTDKDGNPLRDRFCISVRDVSDYGNGHNDNLQSNLLLSSDLRGYIHDPAWYLAAVDEEHREALNLLTLVQGWERYEWETMTGLKPYHEKHRIEDSLTMNGWVLSYSLRKPVSDIDVYAAVMPNYDKTKSETFQYHTDSTGYFGFNLADFYGDAKMSVNLMSKRRNGQSRFEKSTRIQFERSDRPESRPFVKQQIDLNHNKNRNLKKEEDIFTDDGLPLVIRQDLGIVLDDVDITEKRQFVDYDTYQSWDVQKETEMQLDLGEYTTDVYGYFLEKGIRLDYGNISPFFYVHDDVQLLDKKPFDDPMAIDMIDVKSIIFYDRPRPMIYFVKLQNLTPLLLKYRDKRIDGEWYRMMMTNILTPYYLIDIQIKNESERMSYDDIRNLGRRTTTVQGFSRPVEFYSPQYPEGPVFGDEDIRRTLYWNPNVITDDEGNARVEFYNNSYSQRYTVRGAGITASGIPYILNQNW